RPEAGEADAAVRAWERAGERALAGSAHAEAALHLEAGIALLQTLPETPERSRHELALQLRLGEARSWTHGYAATETGHAYARARELCERVGEDDSRGLLFLGLWASALNRGELRSAQELAE